MKPQSAARPLDGRDASPHLRAMAEREDDRKGGAEGREAKLAQALRANLRRRKTAGITPPAPNPQKNSTD